MTQIDWQSGRIDLESDDGTGPAWSLVVASDWAPLDETAQSIGESEPGEPFQALMRDPMRFYGGLATVLRDADLSIVNLECVLGNEGKPTVKDGPHLRLPACAVDGLVAAPFHLACLANNHSMDFGPQGLARTRQLLSEKDIFSVGAGLDGREARQPFVTQVKGVRLAVVNAAEGEEARSVADGPGAGDFDRDRLVQQIAALRNQADVVVAILHAGREWVPVPPPYVYHAYRTLVEAGADLVVGHHPHVPQGVEVYQGRPIAYSLGNFALWTPKGVPFRRLGYLLKAHFRGARLARVEIVPYRMLSGGLTVLSEEDRVAFLADLAQASEPLSESSKVEAAWHAYADCWLECGLAQDMTTISSLLLDEVDLRTAWLAALSRHRGILVKPAQWSVRVLGKLMSTSKDDHHHHQDQARGVAILRNRYDAPAHRELYLTALQRQMDVQRDPAPDWALDLIERWEVFA
jgi:poly-gamma-glutamate capsule biosynthesis protein CapA/YwtB (metallophosphatase superfamily)